MTGRIDIVPEFFVSSLSLFLNKSNILALLRDLEKIPIARDLFIKLDSFGVRIVMLDLRIVVVILSQPTLLLCIRLVIILKLSPELIMVGNFLPLEFDLQDNFQMFKYYY